MFDFQIFGISTVGAIMAIVDRLKDFGFPKKYVPFVAIGLGIAAGVFMVDPHNLTKGLVDGLFVGLSAIGVHSSVKNVREGVLEVIEQSKEAVKEEEAPAQQQEQQQ